MKSPPRHWTEFPTYKKRFEFLKPLFYLFSNLELVESDTFYNFYELNRQSINYIKNNNDYDDKIKSRIDNLYKFYNFESMLDQDSLEFSKLNRY